VFSLLQAYGGERGGELPGSWFVAMLEPLGIPADTVRQTLYRMTKSKALTNRRVGAFKLYRLTRYGKAGTDAGTSRLLKPPEKKWDGLWLVVVYKFQSEERVFRDQVKGLLELEGFASLSRGTYLHPRDRSQGLRESVGEHGLADRLTMFRGRQIEGQSNRDLVRRLWDLEGLRAGYSAFIRDFSPLRRRSWSRTDPHQALRLRFAFVLRYLEIAWKDPGLPLALLGEWPAGRAQAVASHLHGALHQPLLDHGDAVMERVCPTHLLGVPP
jgi:DNA-binding transcriptional regulator PaaX